jgi:hypothetical protein
LRRQPRPITPPARSRASKTSSGPDPLVPPDPGVAGLPPEEGESVGLAATAATGDGLGVAVAGATLDAGVVAVGVAAAAAVGLGVGLGVAF